MKRTLSMLVLMGPIAAMALAGAAADAAPKARAKAVVSECGVLSAADKVVALNEIQNLMGRYGHLGTLRGEGTLAELFALDTEGVSWKTPGGPVGIAGMRARFSRPDEVPTPGVLHIHSMFSPVIEIAGDGKTAKGVWDSFGPNVPNANAIGGWLWVKYAVDFVKEHGKWKIWHLQVNPVFNVPYDKSLTQAAKEAEARAGAESPGVAPPRAGPGGPPSIASLPGYQAPPKDLWRYDGKSVPRGPYIPEPYCHFDAAKAY